jgi:hypothetical protein
MKICFINFAIIALLLCLFSFGNCGLVEKCPDGGNCSTYYSSSSCGKSGRAAAIAINSGDGRAAECICND